MTQIIGGHNLGLQFGSQTILGRFDTTGKGTFGHGEQSFVNIANGNLIFQDRDAFLPSFGMDFDLVRTYNSRGTSNGQANGWTFFTRITLAAHQDKPIAGGSQTGYTVTYGDATSFDFNFDSAKSLWVSTDGDGAYETLQQLSPAAGDGARYVVTRADQTQYRFDKDFLLVSIVDTNAVSTKFTYQGGKLVQVKDDTGHTVNLIYSGLGNLASLVDETGAVLCNYGYSGSLLTSVTDRDGHTTVYHYDNNGNLDSLTMPDKQVVNGQMQTFQSRTITFGYQKISWDDHPYYITDFDKGFAWVLTQITDADGGVTTFDYGFQFGSTSAAGDRDLAFQPNGGRDYQGGSTRVVDALGNARATSNAAEYVAWRMANNYYATYDAATVNGSAAMTAQYNAIRNAQSVVYTYDPNSQISQVTDELGFQTNYTYDAKGNLASITDANGWGAVNSDSAYFRALRAELGFTDIAGNGKLVSALSAAEKTAILNKFTSFFTYDANGNLVTATDNAGNVTTYTYTAFNKVATMTSALGHVTTYSYDAKQNLSRQVDGLGNIIDYTYDPNGDLTKKTVYLDKTDLLTAAKQQVTQYFYDGFANNVKIVDAENNVTTKTFDHFGNVTTTMDGRNGLTTFAYDADDRILAITDPEGFTTSYAYDSVGNRISIKDTNGHIVTQVFDKNNLLLSTIDPSATSASFDRHTTYQYDILGNGTQVTDAEGRKMTYSWDAHRQLVDVATDEVLDGSEQLVAYHQTLAYDGEGNIVTTTDRNGNVTQYLFTTTELVRRMTDAVGNVTEYIYDKDLRQVQVTVGAQLALASQRRVLLYGYDNEDQLTSETDALGKTKTMVYDAAGNVVAVTDENQHTTNFEYDRNNRRVREIRPEVLVNGTPKRYTVIHQFDENGNEVSTTDENGHTTTLAYDRDNRLVLVTDANGIQTVFGYDSRDNRTSVSVGVTAHVNANRHVEIDGVADAQVTTFVYDEFNQIIAKTDGVGNALVTSDNALYQQMRTKMGFAAMAGVLSAADKTALLAKFTDKYTYDRVGNAVSITDHKGRVTTTTFDALNRIESQAEAIGTDEERTTTFRYDGNDNRVKLTDARGKVETSTYDAVDRLVDRTSPLNVTTHNTYDNVGNLVSETRAFDTTDARTTTYDYDLNDRLTGMTDPESHTTSYEYDFVGNRRKIVDGRSGVTELFYDALDRNIKVKDPLGLNTVFEYDGVGNRIAIVDARGGVTKLEYDPGDRYVKTTDAEGRITKFAYDVLGNRITQTTAFTLGEAETTTFQYDAEGNLRQVTDAAGKVTTSDFDELYNRTAVTDGNGHTTTYGFDALNRQVQVTDAKGGVTVFTYDLEDNVVQQEDAEHRVRTFAYDDGNRLITETDALGVQTTYAYDKADNRVSITRAANKSQAATTTFTYDKDDRLVERKDALGGITKYAYDANDNIVTVTDANGHVTKYDYDADDRVKQITDAENFVTQYKYDANGNRTQVIDGRGATQTTYYNKDNEVVLTIDGVGAATAFSYDGNGNVVKRIDYMTLVTLPVDPAAQPTPTANAAQDRTTKYEYDALNRLTKQTDAEGGVSTATYDAVGNKKTETDENTHTTSYDYDELDRLTTVTNALGKTRTFTYDAVGNELTVTDENGHTVTSTYDLENRLETRADPFHNKREYTYDAVGNTLTEKDQNGHVTTYEYDLLDRVKTEKNPLLGTIGYTYDAVGNVTTTTDENSHTTTLVYDKVDNLVSSTNALGKTRSFTYDAAGNVLTVKDENGNATTFVYDKVDQLTSEKDALAGVHSRAYDAAGNLVSETNEGGKTWTYVYDRLNRTTKVTDPLGGTRIYTYDAVGNRTGDTDENNHKTTFAYDELDRLVAQTDALGGIRSYTYDAAGNTLSETDENSHKIVYAYDANDRLVAQLSAEGFLTTFEYDKVGNKTAAHAYRNHYSLGAGGAFPTPAAGDMPRDMIWTYDDNDRLKTEKDPVGMLTTYEYDAAGNQKAVVMSGPVGATRRRETTYDAADRVTDTKDELGFVTHFVLDNVGNVLERHDDWDGTIGKRVTKFTYDTLDRVKQQTDALLYVTQFDYDALGQLKTRTSAVLKPEQRIETFEYDDNGRLVAQVNGAGERTEFKYDKVGNRIQITVAPGADEQRINKFEYDGDDRMKAEVDGNGVRTEYKYDAIGNRIEVIQAAGLGVQERHTLMTYSADDRLLSVVDPIGYARAHSNAAEFQAWRTEHGYAMLAANLNAAKIDEIQATQRTSYEYDDMGNQTKITDADGTITNNTFDAGGRLLTNSVGANAANGGVKTTNSYDAFGNVLTSKQEFATGADTDARTMTYEYDKLDRQTRVTDGEGFSTDYTYDAFGNLTGVKRGVYVGADPAKLAATHVYNNVFTYDKLDRLTISEDGNHNQVVSTYDGLGNRLTQKTGVVGTGGTDVAHASTVTFLYDKAGRVIEKQSGTDGVVRITYDKAGNQKTQKTLQSGDPDDLSAVWVTQKFDYDGNGRVTASYDSYNTKTAHVFDAVGNETGTVFAQGVDGQQRTVQFRYDLDNNMVASVDALGNQTTFAHDAVGNLVKQTDALGRVTWFYYDAFHRVIGQIDARNFVTTFARDAAGNITQTKLYATALAGAITDATPFVPPAASDADRTITSKFDRASQLVRQDSPDGSFKTFAYDSGGKLLTLTQSPAPSLASWTANPAPRVVKFKFDDAGRLIRFDNADGSFELYTYDAANNKTSESLNNPTLLAGGRKDPPRQTSFEYDLDNRLKKQIFDPSGLQATQTLAYDRAGNVISKTDENGGKTTSDFDRDNRVSMVTDPVGFIISYGYDLLGNLTSATNARGYTVFTEYDLDNRVVKEILPEMSAVTLVNGLASTETVTPMTVTTYDAVGNIVQITDARLYTQTRWYDASGNVIAERSGDGAVRTYTYDAFGDLLTVTQDMQFNTDAVILAKPPQVSSDVRMVTNTYDRMGRITKTQFSKIDVTKLSDVSGSSPTSSTETATPQEETFYNGFGETVETVDRNGRHSYAYYDLLGRQIAAVDAAGYLTQTDYDSLGNVVQQRKYATKLASVAANVLPTAPAGTPATVDRIYDIAGRLFEEISSAVQTSSGKTRVVTRFTYDAAGNLITKTLGYATIVNGVRTDNTTNPRLERYFYDAGNHRIAVVNPSRVLSVFSYDGNGNVFRQKRFFMLVPSAINLATATLGSIFSAIQGDPDKDETTDYTYDSGDRVATRTDRMGPQPDDDIVNVSGYDAMGNLTYRKDPNGFVSLNRYDAAEHIVESLAPNGSDTFIQYDTSGQKIRAWTGGAPGSTAPAATIVGARVANGPSSPVFITWNQSGNDITSWVAWDTTSHETDATKVPSSAPGLAGDYGHASPAGTGISGGDLSASIFVASGQTIYFRIMSKDTAGNLTWTAEQSLVVPPRIKTITTAQSGTSFTVTVTFDRAITGTATLSRTTPPLSVEMTASNNDQTFTATFTGTKGDDFVVSWVDDEKTYSTADIDLLTAPGTHAYGGDIGWIKIELPSDGTGHVGDGQFVFANGVLQRDTAYMGAINGSNVLVESSKRVNDTLNAKLSPLLSAQTAEYDVAYGNLSTATHSAAISFSQHQSATYSFDHYIKGAFDVIVATVWNIVWQEDPVKTSVQVTLQDDEIAKVGSDGVHVAYRTAQNGLGGFTDAGAAAKSGNDYSLGGLTLTAGSSYDIKVFYTDTSGREVIVEFRRVNVPANAALPATTQQTVAGKDNPPTLPAAIDVALGTQSYTGDRSLQVLAQETNGSASKSGTTLTVTAGQYVGPYNPKLTSLVLTLEDTANNTGVTKHADGFADKTYYTEIEYNALGMKIATNEDTGLWRRFGVDKNGNTVETRLYGTQQAELDDLRAVTTYKVFDELNREIATFGANSAAGRAVTRLTYDYSGHAVKQVDPGNTDANDQEFVYDEVGNLVSRTDAEGNTTTYVYNAFGQLVMTTDANGHIRRKVYDEAGRLIEESVDGSTDHRFYSYDAFDRQTAVRVGATVAASTASTLAYDQHDRVISVTDPLGGITRYFYDGRDNQVWTQDANGNWFGQAYDSANMITHRYAFSSTPTGLADAQARVASTDPTLRDEKTVYDLFGNKISITDAAGRKQLYTYGAFGRLESVTNGYATTFTYNRFGDRTGETNTNGTGKNIAYDVDDAGHLVKIDDIATNTRTTYTYDVAGRRLTELLEKGSPLATVSNYSYVYDHNGWILSWTETAHGMGETLAYDKVGNVVTMNGFSATSPTLLSKTFTYDSSDRVLTGAGNTYTYDTHGRRASWNNGTTTISYSYDANDRVTSAGSLKWTYDKVGNITSVTDSADISFTFNSAGYVTAVSGKDKDRNYAIYLYDSTNFNWYSESSKFSDDHHDGYQQTTTYTDKAGRVTSVSVQDAGDPGDQRTFTYTYEYNADGTEHAVTISGTASESGSSSSTYDVNAQLTLQNQGKGDGLDHDETKTFTYDNAGHIISVLHDTGEDDDKVNGAYQTKYYLYANDEPVGEYIDANSPTLDTGNLVIRNVPGSWPTEFPDTTVTDYIVAPGDSLQSIAAQIYGHPELWYVIADANGLTGAEALQVGQRLAIPNTVQYVGNSVQDHNVYRPGDIIGSKLPNLTAPPTAAQTCKIVAAIILIVIVAILAVVVTVLTVGAAAPAAAAALGVATTSAIGIIVGIAIGAAVGAAVGFVSSVITQGILIGFGLQKEFDWKQVAADTVAGLFSGAAGGLGAMVQAANAASLAVKIVNVVGQTVLEVAGELSRQAIANDGRIDNWVGVALAGAGGALGALASKGIRAERNAEKVAQDVFQLSEINKIASKPRLLKAAEGLEVGDTVFKNSASKFKAVLQKVGRGQQGPSQLVIKRFERLSALRKVDRLIEADTSQMTKWEKIKNALRGGVIVNPKSTLTAGQRFRSVARQGLIDQTSGIKDLFRSARQGIKEFRQSGTVGKSALQWTGRARYANTTKTATQKTIKTFETKIDRATGVTSRVAVTRKVFRNKELGVNFGQRLKQFGQTFSIEGIISSSQKIDKRTKTTWKLKEVELAHGQIQREVIIDTAAIRKSWAKKIVSGGETIKDTAKTALRKKIHGYEEFQDATGAWQLRQVDKWVYRQRFLRTTRGDKIADFFGTKTGTVGKRFLNILANKEKTDKFKKVVVIEEQRLKTGQVKQALVTRKIERLHALRESTRAQIYDHIAEDPGVFVATYVGKIKLVAAQYEAIGFVASHTEDIGGVFTDFSIDKVKELKNEYSKYSEEHKKASDSLRSAFKFFTGGKFSVVQLAMGVKTAYGNVSSILDENRDQQTPFMIRGHPERDTGRNDFADREAASTFFDDHERQHGWTPINWTSTAASATTQIYSPFAIDRAADFATVLGSNRMVSGQVAQFNARSVAGYVAGTVGRVAMNVVPNPIVFLDPNPVAPRG